jgi:hypothetical protein
MDLKNFIEKLGGIRSNASRELVVTQVSSGVRGNCDTQPSGTGTYNLFITFHGRT